jgi:sulfur carrier protein ThiS
VVDITRGASTTTRRITVPSGTLVRAVLRSLGHAAEGSAVLVDDVPIPLDTPLEAPTRLTVIPTFSGG